MIDVLHCPTGAATSEKVCTYDRCGQCFGELELFYGKPGEGSVLENLLVGHSRGLLVLLLPCVCMARADRPVLGPRWNPDHRLSHPLLCAGHGSGRKYLASEKSQVKPSDQSALQFIATT